MPDYTPSLFPELIIDRLEHAIQRLGERHWSAPLAQPRITLEQTKPYAERRHPRDLADHEFIPVVKFPYRWGRMFEFSTYRLRFDEAVGAGVYLYWRDQAEATLYIDGVPYWGLDALHSHCLLPEGTREVLIESVCCRTGIWGGATGIDEEGSRNDGPQLVHRNDVIWQLWVDFDAARDVINVDHSLHSAERKVPAQGPQFHPEFHHMSPATRKWLRAVDRALDRVDREDYEGAHARMEALFRALPQGMAGVKAVLTGHAHIDLVWMWTERVGEFKATHTFSTMNRLLEQYPEFVFGYSQPASYDAVGSFSPELLAKVKEKIAGGRWEALGAAYVESDTQLSCGESLARSLVIGQEGFEALSGKPSPILWLPDVFGYCACLPQIMQQCDVKYFFTTKMTWSAINRFPYSSFRWQGADGSEVLVHLSTGGNGYNSHVSATELMRGAMEYRQADVHDAFLLPSGYGDGGGGVSLHQLERARRFRKVPQLPETAWGRIDTFFESLEPVADSLPAYRGELYLEYHRGVQTTHGNLKSAFRGLERALQMLEAAHAMAGLGPVDPQLWKRMVFAQFHDYIPGSSIPEVYAEHVPELTTLAQQAIEAATAALSGSAAGQAWFNPLPYAVYQSVGEQVVTVPPLGCVGAEGASIVAELTPVRVANNVMENGIVRAAINANGEVESLEIDGLAIDCAAPLGKVVLYRDNPALFQAWDIDYAALNLADAIDSPVAIVSESSLDEVSIVCNRAIGNGSSLTIRYSLQRGDTVLRIRYLIDWQERERLLKVHFPTRYMGRNAIYGAPFGSMARPQLPGTRVSEAQWEVPGSRWAVVCDDALSAGLFMVTEAKYGFGCRSGDLHLSLVRSAVYPEMKNRPQLRNPANETHTDIGQHVIEIAIGAFDAAAPRERQPFALADTLFTRPLALSSTSVQAAIPTQFSAGNSLHCCWVKPLDSARYVLRFNEILGKSGTLQIAPDPRIQSLAIVDLRDRVVRELELDASIPYGPYELLGVRIELHGGDS